MGNCFGKEISDSEFEGNALEGLGDACVLEQRGFHFSVVSFF